MSRSTANNPTSLESQPSAATLRTTDVYEQIPGYPSPPLPPLPAWGEFRTLWPEHLDLTPGESRLLARLLRMVGFKTFYDRLPENLEGLLRHTNLRTPGLDSLVISASIALQDDPRQPDPFQRAAGLVIAARQLYLDLIEGRFPPDTLRGEPLEMGQYPNLFSTSLRLDHGRVIVHKSTCRTKIAVLIRGQFFILEIGEPGNELTLAELAHAFASLVAGQAAGPGTGPIATPALLTSIADRPQRMAYASLSQQPENQASLAALQDCFLTVCFDLDDRPESPDEAMLFSQSRNLANRWFYSSLQLVVFGSSRACTLCNFTTYLDGNTMMRGSAELQRRASQLPLEDYTQLATEKITATPLHWKVDPAIIPQAQAAARPLLDDQQATFTIPDFNRQVCRVVELDPVSTFVLALQLAAFELTGQQVHISQFLAMNKYRCMDLAIVDVSTPAVRQFAQAVSTPGSESGQSALLLRQALASIQAESQNARKAISFNILLTLFMRTRTQLQSFMAIPLLRTTRILLNKRHASQLGLVRDVIISHPAIYPEIPAVGRPGVRIPYARFFGLHYQIFDDRTVVTMMPGIHWPHPNSAVIASIQTNLARLVALASQNPTG
jgi:hypothetical protein